MIATISTSIRIVINSYLLFITFNLSKQYIFFKLQSVLVDFPCAFIHPFGSIILINPTIFYLIIILTQIDSLRTIIFFNHSNVIFFIINILIEVIVFFRPKLLI